MDQMLCVWTCTPVRLLDGRWHALSQCRRDHAYVWAAPQSSRYAFHFKPAHWNGYLWSSKEGVL